METQPLVPEPSARDTSLMVPLPWIHTVLFCTIHFMHHSPLSLMIKFSCYRNSR